MAAWVFPDAGHGASATAGEALALVRDFVLARRRDPTAAALPFASLMTWPEPVERVAAFLREAGAEARIEEFSDGHADGRRTRPRRSAAS